MTNKEIIIEELKENWELYPAMILDEQLSQKEYRRIFAFSLLSKLNIPEEGEVIIDKGKLQWNDNGYYTIDGKEIMYCSDKNEFKKLAKLDGKKVQIIIREVK